MDPACKPPLPSSLAPIKPVTQVHLEKWPLKQREKKTDRAYSHRLILLCRQLNKNKVV